LTQDGKVSDPVSGQSATYGELAVAAARQAVPENVPLKAPAEFRLLGRDHPRLDSRIKVTGAAGFGLDVRLPELRDAAVARPPVFGASLKSFDDSAAKAMPGVVKVKAVLSGVAVIADSTWRAIQARDALQIVWDEGEHAKRGTAGMLEVPRAGRSAALSCSSRVILTRSRPAAQVIETTEFPSGPCLHGPMNCGARSWRRFRSAGGNLDRHADQTSDRQQAAAILGYEPEAISCTRSSSAAVSAGTALPISWSRRPTWRASQPVKPPGPARLTWRYYRHDLGAPSRWARTAAAGKPD
jgi:isoquinoline 1-oxidoreductase beta subunit